MKVLLISLISLMISNTNLTSNRMISNSNYPVESSLVISEKNGENIEGKYKIEQIGNNKFKTTITGSGDFAIEGTSKHEVAKEIVVGPNFDGSITIKDLKLFYNYSSSMKSPIDIDASSNVNLIIDGDNSIRAPQYYPAIGFYGENNSGTLTLSSINDGYLYALGGGSGAAAIGDASGVFGESTNSGNIIINSGYYIDSMGSAGPAIGSGFDNGHIEKVEINGGEIKVSALNSFSKNAQGAAIGTGSYGEVCNIIINGGNITIITDKGVEIDEKDYNINSLNEDYTLYLYVTKENHKVVIKKDNENVIYSAKFDGNTNSFDVKSESDNPTIPWEEINPIPVIETNDIELKVNSEFNEEIALNGVTAYDTEDKDLTKYVRVIDDNVNTSVVETYSLTYEVKDFDNYATRKTINVFVINNDEKDPSNDILINTIIITCTSIIIVVIIGLGLHFFFKKGK